MADSILNGGGWRKPNGKHFYRPVDTGPLAKLEVFHLPLPKCTPAEWSYQNPQLQP
jgi:hypothetical protein